MPPPQLPAYSPTAALIGTVILLVIVLVVVIAVWSRHR